MLLVKINSESNERYAFLDKLEAKIYESDFYYMINISYKVMVIISDDRKSRENSRNQIVKGLVSNRCNINVYTYQITRRKNVCCLKSSTGTW